MKILQFKIIQRFSSKIYPIPQDFKLKINELTMTMIHEIQFHIHFE